jgi:hypothetical protein
MSGAQLTSPGNVTPAQFKSDFPAFFDGVLYPEATCALYLNLAAVTLDPNRFGDYLNLASELFAAHFLTLDMMDNLVAARGGAMGQQGGAIGSKSVGGVSINYALGYDTEPNAGHWNLTTFGKRVYRLIKMAGMGGVQVTGAQTSLGGFYPGTSA